MPYAIAWSGIAVVESTIYLLGGSSQFCSSPVRTVMAYDPASDTWTRKTDMPLGRSGLSACVAEGEIGPLSQAQGRDIPREFDAHDLAAEGNPLEAMQITSSFQDKLRSCRRDGDPAISLSDLLDLHPHVDFLGKTGDAWASEEGQQGKKSHRVHLSFRFCLRRRDGQAGDRSSSESSRKSHGPHLTRTGRGARAIGQGQLQDAARSGAPPDPQSSRSRVVRCPCECGSCVRS